MVVPGCRRRTDTTGRAGWCRAQNREKQANKADRAAVTKAYESGRKTTGSSRESDEPNSADSPGSFLSELVFWAEYDYVLENWLGVGLEGHTPESVMEIFKKNPREIFPFGVEGCDEFVDGARCRLVQAIPLLLDSNGWVTVSTTDTSVRFVVDSYGYFDGPGSTIEFSVIENSEGLVLRQEAHAINVDFVAAAGVEAGLVRIPWATQAANLREAILTHGGEK